jgi:Pentapeptide repeats (8 copies)
MSWLRSLRQRIKQHWIIVGIAVIAGVIALIFAGYWLDWTGFNVYSIVWTVRESNSTTLAKVDEQQPAKTLWDWLQLAGIVAIPVAVGVGATRFTTKQAQVSEEANRKQRETELQIAESQQRETTLQLYLDRMSELLLERNLRKSKLNTEPRNIARARTLTVLRRLDANRKGSVLQFLHEADLFHIISLSQADLSRANLKANYLGKADLSFANLEGADLSFTYMGETILIGANLKGASLYLADLSGAHLRDAIVTAEQLGKAKSLKGATMPDGTKHS